MMPDTPDITVNILDIIAIAFGLVGTVLNALLFWVLSKNPGVDKKCCVIYQNLAAVDVFNCLVIPLCYLTITGSGYQFMLEDAKNSILYLLFGATVNIPYMLLILLSCARVMIFRHQVFYTQRVSLGMVRGLCVVCWFLSLGGLGIWMCYLMSGSARITILIDLMKSQSVALFLFSLGTLLLIAASAGIIQHMIYHMKRAGRRGSVQSTASRQLSESTALLSPQQLLVKELSAAQRTFYYFFWSILICSSFPITFSVSFTLCGPYYNSTTHYCAPFNEIQAFRDPKSSYAIMLLFLCGMSITNSIILLRQRSFRTTIRGLCNCNMFRPRSSAPRTEAVAINRPAPSGIKERVIRVMMGTSPNSNQTVGNME